MSNMVLERGILGIPSSAVLIPNYDNAEKSVGWDTFKSKYKFLDPSGIETSAVLLSIAFPDLQERLLYGNKVVKLEPTVSSSADPRNYRILLPLALVLILDAQGNIRGKVLSAIQTNENMSLSSSQFWFLFPLNMRGATYTVIVELFGYWVQVTSGTASIGGISFITDPYYGLLPENSLQGGTPHRLLAFARESNNAPAPELTLQSALSYASIASTFLGAMTALLVDRRRKIHDFLRDNAGAIALFWICVILFIVMALLIVVLR